MSEATGAPADPPVEAATAGAMLRQARQAQGLHIAALAASIKVTPRKLESLESDRYDELPDATFTRALAQAVCRALKIDAAPVLAKLPSTGSRPLDNVSPGLNATVRSGGGRRDTPDTALLARPMVWAAAVLVLGALLVYLLPDTWLSSLSRTASPEPAASAPSTSVAVAPAQPITATPPPEVSAAASAASSAVSPAPIAAASNAVVVPPGTGGAASAPSAASDTAVAPASPSGRHGNSLQIVTTGASWVEVRDGQGKVLLSRLVPAGEPVLLDGPAPLKVKVGNAAVTRLTFRGQPVPFTTKDNVVRLELP